MVPYDEERKQLIRLVMQLWSAHSENYRTLPLRYRFLLAAKRELGIAPLNVVRKSVIDEYPEIPFLRIFDEDTARMSLEESSTGRLYYLIEAITHAAYYDYAYCTIYNRVVEYTYELNRHQSPKTEFGIDPDKCKGKCSRARKRFVYQDS